MRIVLMSLSALSLLGAVGGLTNDTLPLVGGALQAFGSLAFLLWLAKPYLLSGAVSR